MCLTILNKKNKMKLRIARKIYVRVHLLYMCGIECGYTTYLAEKAIMVVRQRTRKWKRKCLRNGSNNILTLS